MKSLISINDKVDDLCKSNGLKLTDKRKKILHNLIKSDKALSAYEIIAIYNNEYNQNILAMSAYRILDFLENECLIHKLSSINKYVVCSCLKDGDLHEHHEISQFLICKICSRVEEFQIKKSVQKQLISSIKKLDFSLASPQIEISCICNNCKSSAA